MALRLQVQLTAGGSFTEVDLTASRVGNFKLKFSTSAPATLSFTVGDKQHELTTIGLRKYIKFWDEGQKLADGTTDQSDSMPLFEGWTWEAQPAESNLVQYVAYDAAFLAGKETPVMSVAWDPPAGAGLPATPGTGAVPRLIVNNTITNDVDYAFSRQDGLQIGDIIEVILDDAIEPLRTYLAAPAAGTAFYGPDLAAMTYEPQEKQVFTNETINGALQRLVSQYYPDWYFFWMPGLREWRWFQRSAGTPVTLTLNDPDADNVVLSMELHRSLEGRYPAVKFFGPEARVTEYFSTTDGTLQAIGTPTVLQEYDDATGHHAVTVYPSFQIVDPDKRRGSKLLPASIIVRDSDYHWVGTMSPMFEISFDNGDTWMAVESIWLDFQNGTANCPFGTWIYFWSDQYLVPGSTQQFWIPTDYRLIWAYYIDPITVRYPTSGYSGTSYTVAGQTSEFWLYDEMLAVGYNRVGLPVTTASRVAQFEALAQNIHASRKDITYTGGCQIHGIRYQFCRLDRLINLAAVDEDGGTITTGWEAISAVLTDVEYDFAEQITTLTFSAEALQIWGDNIDLLKERLRIGLVERIRIIDMQPIFSTFQSPYTKGAPIKFVSGIVYNDYDLWYDKRLGTTEGAL